MGWETPKSGGPYYTRSRKLNGRVTREYVGGGLIGELAAQIDANARRDREAKMAAWRVEKAEIESREKVISGFSEHVEILARSALVAAGFHRHHRGEWRKKRLNEIDVPRKWSSDEVNALCRRADKGDEGAVVELREVFNNTPDLWEQAGNLARQAENALMSAATGVNELAKEAIYGQLASQKRELAGPHPTALERLLVERIALCWFDLHHADTFFFQNCHQMTIPAAEYRDRYRDRAQKRYLSAIKTLAQVRRLLTPTVQVNIANQQVNTARL